MAVSTHTVPVATVADLLDACWNFTSWSFTSGGVLTIGDFTVEVHDGRVAVMCNLAADIADAGTRYRIVLEHWPTGLLVPPATLLNLPGLNGQRFRFIGSGTSPEDTELWYTWWGTVWCEMKRELFGALSDGTFEEPTAHHVYNYTTTAWNGVSVMEVNGSGFVGISYEQTSLNWRVIVDGLTQISNLDWGSGEASISVLTPRQSTPPDTRVADAITELQYRGDSFQMNSGGPSWSSYGTVRIDGEG